MDPDDFVFSPPKRARLSLTESSPKPHIDATATEVAMYSKESSNGASGPTLSCSALQINDASTNAADPANEPESQEQEYIDPDDDEDDTYRLNVNPERARKISDKKRLDTAAFQSWVANNQREVTRDSARAANSLSKQSVESLVRDGGGRLIIASPREYQVELFERAKKQNTIVVLDTGLLFPCIECLRWP
jgi:hypothetical protein